MTGPVNYLPAVGGSSLPGGRVPLPQTIAPNAQPKQITNSSKILPFNTPQVSPVNNGQNELNKNIDVEIANGTNPTEELLTIKKPVINPGKIADTRIKMLEDAEYSRQIEKITHDAMPLLETAEAKFSEALEKLNHYSGITSAAGNETKCAYDKEGQALFSVNHNKGINGNNPRYILNFKTQGNNEMTAIFATDENGNVAKVTIYNGSSSYGDVYDDKIDTYYEFKNPDENGIFRELMGVDKPSFGVKKFNISINHEEPKETENVPAEGKKSFTEIISEKYEGLKQFFSDLIWK